jgi:integrase/recombinase XerD
MDEITVYEPGEITPANMPLDLASLLAEWDMSLEQRVQAQEISPDTAQGYHRGAEKFLTWLQRRQPNGEAIRAWKAELLKVNKPGSVNQWLAGVKSFFTWLAEQGQIPFNPTQAVKGAKRKTSKKHRRQPLTDAEARAILEQPDTTTPEGCRDRAMLALMLYAAPRTVELYRADFQDLQNQGNQLALMVQGKGRNEKDESIIIHSTAETAMLEWIVKRGDAPGPLFTSYSDRSAGGRLSRRAIRDIVKKYFKAAGITNPNKTTHSLRHTAITKALQKTGNDIVKVMGMSRHASPDTLMIYAHENDRAADPAEKYIEY